MFYQQNVENVSGVHETFVELNVFPYPAATWDSTTLRLENHLVYQVQVRRRAIGYNLWSDCSRIVVVPVGECGVGQRDQIFQSKSALYPESPTVCLKELPGSVVRVLPRKSAIF